MSLGFPVCLTSQPQSSNLPRPRLPNHPPRFCPIESPRIVPSLLEHSCFHRKHLLSSAMVLPRASIPWGPFRNQAVRTARTPSCSHLWRHIQRRGYASGGDHGATKSGSDLPWYAPIIAHDCHLSIFLQAFFAVLPRAGSEVLSKCVGSVAYSISTQIQYLWNSNTTPVDSSTASRLQILYV